jgi:hypothetical protein
MVELVERTIAANNRLPDNDSGTRMVFSLNEEKIL